ncbi:ATP synthase F1 subunit epsilon [Botrimarina hoheduenensis]|uniref:ATP synthase epsilon chain n=1 Tax=Botrimarina hoheduenensis TaxID=2528000 RepID=A0A5C5WDA0_9BACT|nr:ATP synthase F1 subunit epsilon [Botrimarina hoheduenensis]TWT48858.1 ATP synthase epsilon chain [Botrimarina hoheduenensis]
MAEAIGTLSVSVVTPEETVVQTTVDSLVVPLFDGEIGILRGHAPMIGRLGFGEMRLTAQGVTTRYYVDGGFVQVADNVVSVLTGRAAPLDKLDAEAARTQLEGSLKQLATGDDAIALRDRLVSQARAQLSLVRKL